MMQLAFAAVAIFAAVEALRQPDRTDSLILSAIAMVAIGVAAILGELAKWRRL